MSLWVDVDSVSLTSVAATVTPDSSSILALDVAVPGISFVAPTAGVAAGEKKFRIDIDADEEPGVARVQDMFTKMYFDP